METVVHIDKLGRLVLPVAIRKMFNTDSFLLKTEKNEVKLKPIPSWEEMKGSLSKVDADEFLKTRHKEWSKHF